MDTGITREQYRQLQDILWEFRRVELPDTRRRDEKLQRFWLNRHTHLPGHICQRLAYVYQLTSHLAEIYSRNSDTHENWAGVFQDGTKAVNTDEAEEKSCTKGHILPFTAFSLSR